MLKKKEKVFSEEMTVEINKNHIFENPEKNEYVIGKNNLPLYLYRLENDLKSCKSFEEKKMIFLKIFNTLSNSFFELYFSFILDQLIIEILNNENPPNCYNFYFFLIKKLFKICWNHFTIDILEMFFELAINEKSKLVQTNYYDFLFKTISDKEKFISQESYQEFSEKIINSFKELSANFSDNFKQKIIFKIVCHQESLVDINDVTEIFENQEFSYKKMEKLAKKLTNEVIDKLCLYFFVKKTFISNRLTINALKFLDIIMGNHLEKRDNKRKFKEYFFKMVCFNCGNYCYEIKKLTSVILSKFPKISEYYLLKTLEKPNLDDFIKKNKKNLDLKIDEKNDENCIIGILTYNLEDEYQEIRILAMQIIENFSKNSNSFAKKAKELLFDMLNDESDNVRIEAVKVLSRLKENIEINTFEKDLILFNLKEHKFLLRINLYKMLQSSYLGKKQDLIDVIDNILHNLETFSLDELYIYQTLKEIVSKNLEFSKDCLEKYANFPVNEPKLLNSFHIAKMIIVSNCLAKNKGYPKYYEKHLNLLKEKYPNFIKKESSFNKNNKKEYIENTKNSFFEIFQCKNWDSCQDNLENVSNLEQYFKKIYKFGKSFKKNHEKHLKQYFNLIFLKKLTKLLSKFCKVYKEIINLPNETEKTRKYLNENYLCNILFRIHKLSIKFILPKEICHYLSILKFIVLFFELVYQLKSNFGDFIELKFKNLLQIIEKTNIFLKNSNSIYLTNINENIFKLLQELSLVNAPFYEKTSLFFKTIQYIPSLNILETLKHQTEDIYNVLLNGKFKEIYVNFSILESTNNSINIESKYFAMFKIFCEFKNLDITQIFFSLEYPNNINEVYNLNTQDIIKQENYDISTESVIFLQKINWNVPTNLQIKLFYQAPHFIFSKNNQINLSKFFFEVPKNNHLILLTKPKDYYLTQKYNL